MWSYSSGSTSLKIRKKEIILTSQDQKIDYALCLGQTDYFTGQEEDKFQNVILDLNKKYSTFTGLDGVKIKLKCWWLIKMATQSLLRKKAMTEGSIPTMDMMSQVFEADDKWLHW